jgi:hypothetical protein
MVVSVARRSRNDCADIGILLDYMAVKLRICNWLGFVREPDVFPEGSGPPDYNRTDQLYEIK